MDSRLQKFADYMVEDWNGLKASRIGGLALNFDGRFGIQCMDFFNWVWSELGIPSDKITRTADAAGVWELGASEGIWKYFDKVAPNQPFQPADVFVFNRNAFGSQGRGAGNGYGHIGMVVRDYGSKFQVLETNGLGDGYEDEYMNQYGSPARLHVWDRTDLYGVLRPKPGMCPALSKFIHKETEMVVTPTFVQRPAHPNNYSKGRIGGRNGQFTFHHVVGPAESAAVTFANPYRQASAHFTVTDIPGVIMQHVNLDDSSWADGNGASNSRSVSSEHHGDWRFGYWSETVIDNSALLVAWLRVNGFISHFYRHRDVSLIGTECCCDLPCEEIWRRADALIGGASTPVSGGAQTKIEWKKFPTVTRYRINKPTSMWKFDAASWSSIESVKEYAAGEVIEIAGEGYNPELNAAYLVSAFSFDKGIANGFNVADMDKITNSPVVETGISWSTLPGPTEYVFIRDAKLWDFNRTSFTNMEEKGSFKKGDRFTAVATSKNGLLGSTYAVAEYSYKSRTTVGVNVADLELYVAPQPAEPAVPEWQKNSRDIKPVKLTVLTPQTPIINLETGETIKMLGGGTVVDIAKSTTVNGVEYLISSYSASTGAGQGMKRSDLGVPAVPPANEKPKWLENWRDIEDVDMYARADTNLYNLIDSTVVKVLKRGEKIRVASATEVFGQRYAITEYSTTKNEGRGIRMDDLDLKPVIDGPIPAAPNQPDIHADVSWIKDAVGKIADKLGISNKA